MAQIVGTSIFKFITKLDELCGYKLAEESPKIVPHGYMLAFQGADDVNHIVQTYQKRGVDAILFTFKRQTGRESYYIFIPKINQSKYIFVEYINMSLTEFSKLFVIKSGDSMREDLKDFWYDVKEISSTGNYEVIKYRRA